MPIIFATYYQVYNFYIQCGGEGIKCVIFFSIIRHIKIINESDLTISGVFLSIMDIFLAVFGSNRSHSKSNSFNTNSLYLIYSAKGDGKGINSIGNRYYSTIRASKKKSGTKSKTLSSPKSRPYADLYAGRGKPENEPVWVKDNGIERSPFGASWAKDKKDRIPLPSNYPCNYINISDPYNNRALIKESCKGNRVVYIWTYLHTGICLVGSSSNSVERVLSYFEKKYLFLDYRRGVQFLADWGFNNIQLTIIYFAYHKFTTRDIKINEAYYINELNSSLNSQKFVYLPPEPLESVLPFININNRDTSVPIFVYGGPDLKRVLYIFNSKTSIYGEFNIHWSTVGKYLDNLDNKLYDYFSFTSKPLDGSDLDNLLSLNELLDIKSKVDPNIPRRGQRVKLKDLTNNNEYEFFSLSRAAKFIEDTVGVCDTATLRNNMKNNTTYKKRWVIEKL
jgi:hypothetical protein